MSEMARCRHCGEVIGVYEPLITVTGGHAVTSSRALDPELTDRNGEHYHRACFELLNEAPAAG
jgi:hypothetical protein